MKTTEEEEENEEEEEEEEKGFIGLLEKAGESIDGSLIMFSFQQASAGNPLVSPVSSSPKWATQYQPFSFRTEEF